MEIFNEAIRMQFGQENHSKLTFKKVDLAKSKK